jgi:hypothetical protein
MNPTPREKEKLPEDLKDLCLFIGSVIKKVYSSYRGISLCQVRTEFFQHLSLKVNSICRGNYWGSSV